MPTTGRHRGPSAPSPRRPAVAPVIGVLLVGCCVAVLIGAASYGRVGLLADSSPPRSLTAEPGLWLAVVAALDDRRAAAFADGSMSQLQSVYTRASPAGQRDLAALRALVTAGGTAHGVRPRLSSAVAVMPSDASPTGPATRVVVAVVDVMPAVLVVDASGRSDVRPGRGARRWRLRLVRVAGQWRIDDVIAE